VAGRAQREPGQQGRAEARRHQRLDGDEIVGGEGDFRGESGRGALPEQVFPAPVAAGDPALCGEPCQVGGQYLGDREGQQRLAPGWRRRRHDQVHWLGQQDLLADVALAVGRRRALAVAFRLVPEDQRHVHIPGAEHAHRLRRFGLGEPQVHGRVPVVQHRRGAWHERAERRRERGQPQPSGAQPAVDGEFVLGCVEPADDLRGALGQQPSGVGQPDAAARPLDEFGAGLGLQPRQVVAHRGLRVVQRVGGRGHRAVPGYSDEHAEPRYVQHGLTIDGTDRFAQLLKLG